MPAIAIRALLWGSSALFVGQAVKTTGEDVGQQIGSYVPWLVAGAVLYAVTKGGK